MARQSRGMCRRHEAAVYVQKDLYVRRAREEMTGASKRTMQRMLSNGGKTMMIETRSGMG